MGAQCSCTQGGGVPGQSHLRLPFGLSNLPDAARAGDLRAVQRLLRRGQPVNAVKEGMTSLHWGVQGGHMEIVKALLDAGANPNLQYNIENQQGDTFEWSAIHTACKQGDCTLLICLLEHGGDPNKEAYNKMTPLHAATWHGKKDIIDILIKHGCDVNRLDWFQESPICIPICHGDAAVVEQLLEAGCSLNSRSWGNIRKIRGKNETNFRKTMYGRDGPYTLLPLAIKYAWLHIARLLLRHGINPNKYEIEIILQHIKVEVGMIGEDACRLVRCLLDAGYRFRSRDFLDLQRLWDKTEYDPGYNPDLIKELMAMVHEPASLQQLCRHAVRGHLRKVHAHRSILKPIRELPLPVALRDFLALTAYVDPGNGVMEGQLSYEHTEKLYLAMPRKPPPQRHPYVLYWGVACWRCNRKKIN